MDHMPLGPRHISEKFYRIYYRHVSVLTLLFLGQFIILD